METANLQEIDKRFLTDKATRAERIKASIVDAESQTIQIPISSETPVIRNAGGYLYYEVLQHDSNSVDLSRANDGAAVLLDHGGEQIGVFESAFIQDGKVVAQLRFSKNNERAKQIFADIQDGIVRNFSIDYSIKQTLPVSEKFQGKDLVRANQWELLAVSVVTIPADKNVGAGRSDELPSKNGKQEEVQIKEVPEVVQEPKIQLRTVSKMENLELEKEVKRREEIDATVEQFAHVGEVKQLGMKAIKTGMTVTEFRSEVLDTLKQRGAIKVVTEQIVPNEDWLPEADARSYSISKAVSAIADGRALTGIEAEVEKEMSRRGHTPSKGNLVIPFKALMGARANNTTAPGSAGGYLIGETQSDFIPALRNSAKTIALGAQVISGLKDTVIYPKGVGSTSASWVGETQSATASNPTFGQIVSQPKFLKGLSYASRSFMAQTNGESIIRNDLTQSLGLALDSAVLAGTGGNQPVRRQLRLENPA